ncbi:MAG: hypothetical protein Q9174_005601, partial [Haloplaca sp. 1 TL-2023]
MENHDDSERNGKEPFPWHLGVYDAHCHPTDTIASRGKIAKMKARALTIMATRGEDQDLGKDFASHNEIKQGSHESLAHERDKSPECQIVPSFGWHPWFSHQIFDDTTPEAQSGGEPDQMQHYRLVLTPSPDDGFISSLPKPRSLSGLLMQIRGNLESHASALVGEIGIDRSFRLPEHWAQEEAQRSNDLTPGGREGRRLTPYRVDIEHQKKILKAQLNLAGEMGRAVSVHGVAAHGVMFELIKETWQGHEIKIISKREKKRKSKPNTAPHPGDEMDVDSHDGRNGGSTSEPYPPRICLHSYSGPLNVLEQYLYPNIPAAMFFSFSCLVNFSSRTSKAVQVIKEVPDDKILVESDLHSAGEEMDKLLEDAVRSVCEIKGWSLVEGVTQLGKNWARFVFGETEV